MSDYSEFFLNTPARVVQLELLEIFHPSFSKIYRIVRNDRKGITVTLETGEVVAFQYYPLKITKSNTDDTLDQIFQIAIGDLGELIPNEIDRVLEAGTSNIKPTLFYRVYRSDDLTVPLLGPLRLEIIELPMSRDGSSFAAQAPSVNRNQTGEIYDLTRFPGLRGFL